MAKVTIKDVANRASVSTTTVSHVVNNSRHVEESTRKRVQNAIEELGYKVNSAARSLRAGNSHMLGLVIPDAANLFFADFSRRIEDFGFTAGYNVIICNTDNKTDKEFAYLEALVSKQVDGVIFISSGGDPDHLRILRQNDIPVVIADREIPQDIADVVLLDNEQAGFEITNHLLSLGHRVIGCITGPDIFAPSSHRLNGFLRAHREWGIPYYPELITAGKFSLSSGYTSFERIWEQELKPSALFVFSDMMAIGAMNCAHSKKVRIPDDLSIVGFDNIELASSCVPSLTTYDQPLQAMAETVVAIMLDRIKNKNSRCQRISFRGSLIIRESTISYMEKNAKN